MQATGSPTNRTLSIGSVVHSTGSRPSIGGASRVVHSASSHPVTTAWTPGARRAASV